MPRTVMQADSFVIVNLRSPQERFLGRLIEIDGAGVTLRGLDLGAFEHWIDDICSREEAGVRPSTVFFPLHRIEKIMLDEDNGGIPSFANTFLTRTGTSVIEYLSTL